jgi:regulator of nucleoside diphosphate kinase
MPDQSAAIAAAIREKLSAATVVSRDKIDPSVVTMNSRALFRVNDGPVQSRIVIHDDRRRVDGLTIPITVPLGLALLGLTECQVSIFRGPRNSTEKLQITEVAYQPEAIERQATAGQFFSETRSGPAAGEIVTFSNRRRLDRWLRQPRPPDDDSYPPAA